MWEIAGEILRTEDIEGGSTMHDALGVVEGKVACEIDGRLHSTDRESALMAS